jgi:hypothetical protein
MPKLALLVAASPTPAFYSQLAATSRALRSLKWTAWEPELCVYFGREANLGELEAWMPHLEDVEMSFVSASRYRREGEWAQSDDVFRLAPLDADVLLAIDADVLPVREFEDVVSTVAEAGAVAGCIAHCSFPGSESPRGDWARVTEGLTREPLTYDYEYTLLEYPEPADNDVPFYLNFGAVFFARSAFERISSDFLVVRPAIEERLVDPDFSAQIALTIAIANAGVPTIELPMRFNFPNDAAAEQRFPEELEDSRMIHYLRTDTFDRHEIFVSEREYLRFLDLPMTGANRVFQSAVRELLGGSFPFPTAAQTATPPGALTPTSVP